MTRRILLLCVAALYVLSIPWYRDASEPLRTVAGLPDWAAVALACYALAALLNAAAWLAREARDEGGAAEAGEACGEGGGPEASERPGEER